LAPRPQRVNRRLVALLLQLVEAISQVAEAGQDGRAVAVGGSASVLREGDIPPVMGAVLDGGPMSADERQQGGFILLLGRQAGRIATDFQRGRFLGLMVALGIAFDGNDLPATTQANLLRADGDPGQASAVKAPVFLLPEALRGENPAGRAGVGPYRGCRFGCL
jgi:hypothetical protein